MEVCTTFFEVFTMLCAMLDGSITAHCALALPARSRQRHIAVNILIFILTLDLVVKSIEIIRLVSELPPAVPAFP